MDIEFKKGQFTETKNPEKIKSRINILNKLGFERFEKSEEHQNKRIAEILAKTKYFDGVISNPVLRRDFIEAIAPYADLQFFPKGTSVYFHGEPLYKFSVIIKGRAALYTPRRFADEKNTTKQEIIKIYTEVIRQELFPNSRKLRESRPIKDEEDMLGVRKRMTQIIHETINQKLNEGLAPVIERIMSAKDISHITTLKNSDLSPEEKLFLIANISDADNYIRHGDFDMRNVGHLNVGGTISDINLLQMGLSEYTVVAEDDLYLASFTKDEYSKGFSTAASENLNEKLEFIAKLFPSIVKDSRRKIAFFLEEKQFNKGAIIYKKGSEAEEFYMIKDGEIELLTQKEKGSSMSRSSSNEKYIERKLALNISSSDRFTVGSLQEGMMFGEEDIFNSQPRQFYAVARRPNTFLYSIKKKVYIDVFQTYYPHTALIFRDWFNAKMKYISERIEKEIRKVEKAAEEQTEAPISKREMLKRLEKPKNFTNFLSVNYAPVNCKKKLRDVSDDERARNHKLKLKSSLNMKFPLSLFPSVNNDSVASNHYQKLRLEHIDPISTKRNFYQDQSPIESKRISLSKNKSSLFKKNQVELRKETRALFLPVGRSLERKPPISHQNSCTILESMMQQAIDLQMTSPKVGFKVPPLEEKPLKPTESLLHLELMPSDRQHISMTKSISSTTKNTKLKSLISPLNLNVDLLSNTMENFSSRKIIHNKSPVAMVEIRSRVKRKRIGSVESTPKSCLSTKRETRPWMPPINPHNDFQGWSIPKMDHIDSINEVSHEMRMPSVDVDFVYPPMTPSEMM